MSVRFISAAGVGLGVGVGCASHPTSKPHLLIDYSWEAGAVERSDVNMKNGRRGSFQGQLLQRIFCCCR